jgi:Xaa-Pro aminopeptidase
MILSNEPGVYKKDSHGIRTENLMLVVEDTEGLFGTYLKFETLTLCPICTQGIIKELLTREEVIWLNNTIKPYIPPYHPTSMKRSIVVKR